MKELNTLQESLVAEFDRGDQHIRVPIVKAWELWPPSGALEPQSWVNNYTLVEEQRMSMLREIQYTIQSQLLIYDADADLAAEIAAEFLDAWIDVLDKNITLGQTCNRHALRGGEPTIGVTTWDGNPYTMLETFLDVYIKDFQEFSA